MRYLVLMLLLSAPALADTLTWTEATQNTDGSAIKPPVTENIYGAAQGSAKAPLATGIVGTTWTNPTTPGGAYCYDVTTVTPDGESDHTNEVCLSHAPPRPPGGTTVTFTVQAGNVTAYKRREAIDTYTWVAIGTVTVGTVCDGAHQDDGYRLVPRAFVKMASPLDTMPLNVWAACQ